MAKWLPGRQSGPPAALGALVAVALLLVVGCGSVPAGSGTNGQGPASGQSASGKPGGSHASASAPLKYPQAQYVLCRRPKAAQSVGIVHLGGPVMHSEYGAGQHGASRSATAPAGNGGTMARSLALGLCALPVMPPGVRNCPMAVFDEYRLNFVVDGRLLPTVTVQATGCQQVTGLGRVRWLAANRSFLGQLARAAAQTAHAGPLITPDTATLPGT